MIQIYDISLRFGERLLFENISMFFPDQSRTGLVGKNGAGKTTLLKILAKKMEPDKGTVEIPARQKIGYLPQDIAELGNMSIMSYFLLHSGIQDMEEKITLLEEAISTAQEEKKRQDLLKSYEQLQSAYNALDGYTFRPRAEKILRGLGFPDRASDRLCTTFSGGWKMRIALGSLLLQNPEILLLDEPTNHLDTESMEWLEGYLKGYKGTFLAVSHDRHFLDKITNHTVEIFMGKLQEYKGNFSYYLKEKEESQKQLEKRAKTQQKLRKETEEFIERFRYKSSKATQVQSRIKKLEKETIISAETRGNASVHFTFPECPRSGHQTLTLEHVTKEYGETRVFSDLSFSVHRGEKIAFVGVNGAGKSTLCRILSQKEKPSSGKVLFGHNVLKSFFSQENIDNLHYENTVWQEVLQEGDFFSPQYKRNLLGAFLFSGDAIEKPISVLSGGEKTRLALLKMLLQKTNLLILDEPTNHLDMDTKEIFQQALLAYPGTLIIVSHDRFFLDQLVHRVIEIRQGKGREYLGNYSYFVAKREESLVKETEEPFCLTKVEKEEKSPSQGYKNKEQKRQEAKARQMWAKEKRVITAELAPLEKEIETLEKQKATIEGDLCSPKTLEDPEKRTACLKMHAEIEGLLPSKMEAWETLMEQLHELEEKWSQETSGT